MPSKQFIDPPRALVAVEAGEPSEGALGENLHLCQNHDFHREQEVMDGQSARGRQDGIPGEKGVGIKDSFLQSSPQDGSRVFNAVLSSKDNTLSLSQMSRELLIQET